MADAYAMPGREMLRYDTVGTFTEGVILAEDWARDLYDRGLKSEVLVRGEGGLFTVVAYRRI